MTDPAPNQEQKASDAAYNLRVKLILGVVAVAGAASFLAFCSDSTAPTNDKYMEANASFADNPYQYCMHQDERWLVNVLDRVRSAMPSDLEPTSLRYKELHVSDWWIGDVLDRSRKEVLIRFTAEQSGGEARLMALAEIDPRTCKVDPMEVSRGWDRWADRGRGAFRTK